MKRFVIGMLAHVDAGKTTLSEALLYSTGKVRRLGRVDHKDSFFDTNGIERERGITIFSKQAEFKIAENSYTLLDTPGHVDFSTEAERTLQVLDYAILVVSATDGVQTHTSTLWQMLKNHNVPVFVFINKMDLPNRGKEALIKNLSEKLEADFVDFTKDEAELDEDIATNLGELTEEYIETGKIDREKVRLAISHRRIFPVYFGSALKLDGVDALINGLEELTLMREYGSDFGARVFKITYSEGTRLSYMKITGGKLNSKQILTNRSASTAKEDVWEEKADQLRVYNADKFTTVSEAESGSIVAVTGLTKTYPGEGLGVELTDVDSEIIPVISYTMQFPEGVNLFDAYRKIKILQEEDPQLNIVWDEVHKEIKAQLMGEMQKDVLSRLIMERFSLSVSFEKGSVMYKETITGEAKGIGHFEPLRHYAHVEVRIESMPKGSGITIETEVELDVLARNWQRLILTHMIEKQHIGVLIGAPLTDVKIVLTYGKAHLKHTEGGDFRQATYRAIRNALMNARSQILEPYYKFRLELPDSAIGRAMNDLRKMNAEFVQPEITENLAIISGTAPVSSMHDYAKTVASYTHGEGRLSLIPDGYRVCHNSEEVIEQIDYNPEADLENSPDSVFCAAGAGFVVKWYDVAPYVKKMSSASVEKMPTKKLISTEATDNELMAIFERTYGPIKGTTLPEKRAKIVYGNEAMAVDMPDEYVLIDGYNVIFAWESLKQVARDSIDSAREALVRMMINYNSMHRCSLILVFDAYKVNGGVEKVIKEGGIYIVYTKENELADTFIERAVHKLSKKNNIIRVVTSDGLEQLIVMGHGALRIPALEFEKEVKATDKELSFLMDGLKRDGKAVLNIGYKFKKLN